MFRAFGSKTQVPKEFDEMLSMPEAELKASDIEAWINYYLDSQKYVLWGQFFDIQSKEGRRQAREFILDLLIDLGYTREMIEDE